MTLRIGIDFDNTIINYHVSFYQLALSEGFISRLVDIDKQSIRKAIIEKYGDDRNWQYLQSKVYGKHINNAKVFDGFIEVLKGWLYQGYQIYIVSHKSQFSHFDNTVNLRQYATEFLLKNRIISPDNLDINNVFFLDTLEQKIDKISKLELDVFVDDLDKVLQHKNFPKDTLKIAFGKQSDSLISHRLNDWQACEQVIAFTKQIGVHAMQAWLTLSPKYPYQISQLSRDGNNQIFIVSNKAQNAYLLKRYFQNVSDTRNRAETEFNALSYLNNQGFKQIPKPYYFNDIQQFAYYQYITETSSVAISDSLTIANDISLFISQLQQNFKENPHGFPIKAADSRLCFQDYFNKIVERQRLIIEGCQKNCKLLAIAKFVENEFNDFKDKVIEKSLAKIVQHGYDLYAPFSNENLTLSPSDLGPHNMLLQGSSSYFIDFEYFGIDDPAKMIADLFHHAQEKLTKQVKWKIYQSYCQSHGNEDFIKRFEIIADLIGVEWILIILNIAVPGVIERRQFANAALDVDKLITQRLSKAASKLRQFNVITEQQGIFFTLETNKENFPLEKSVI